MAAPATLDDLRRYVQAGVRRVGQGFRVPSDDWTAVMFVQTPRGLQILGLDGRLFKDGVTKDALAALLREHVARAGAYRYALLLNVHMVEEPSDDQLRRFEAGELHLAQIEGAREQLLLIVGDAESEQCWMADIERNARMLRRAGRWHDALGESGVRELEGRFAGLNQELRPRVGGS